MAIIGSVRKLFFPHALNWFEDIALLEQTANWWTMQSQRVRQCISLAGTHALLE